MCNCDFVERLTVLAQQQHSNDPQTAIESRTLKCQVDHDHLQSICVPLCSSNTCWQSTVQAVLLSCAELIDLAHRQPSCSTGCLTCLWLPQLAEREVWPHRTFSCQHAATSMLHVPQCHSCCRCTVACSLVLACHLPEPTTERSAK